MTYLAISRATDNYAVIGVGESSRLKHISSMTRLILEPNQPWVASLSLAEPGSSSVVQAEKVAQPLF